MNIVVSQRYDWVDNRGEFRNNLDQRFVEFLTRLGGRVFPIPTMPNDIKYVKAWLNEANIKIIVLSGGNDIGSCPQRDALESNLIGLAQELELPLIGVCRGMQMIAKTFGSELHGISNHVNTSHDIIVGSKRYKVNSFHNYAVTKCPAGFSTLARAHDGSIEAFESTSNKILGVMWHPEREDTIREIDQQFFGEFFNSRFN